VRYRIQTSATIECDYACRRCTTTGTTQVRARGTSHEFGDGWFDPIDSDTRALGAARQDLHHDAQRILGLVRCPGCGQRAPNAGAWSALRIAMLCVPSAIALFLGIGVLVNLDASDDFAWMCVVVGVVALLLVRIETARWREAARARSLLSCVRRKGVLPRATARACPAAPAPAARAAAPVVATSAPPPRDPEPPADGEGPRFLRDG
jgi:hypothetical protein